MTAALRKVAENEFLPQVLLSLSKIMVCGCVCSRVGLLVCFVSRSRIAKHRQHCRTLQKVTAVSLFDLKSTLKTHF